MPELSGKTAVVTGGSRGFGRAIVESLAGHGMRVLAVAREREALARLAREAEGSIEPVAADVTSAVRAVEIIQRERPHVLVLNAGARVPIQQTRFLSWEAFAVNWEVDLKGSFIWAREALLAPLPKGSAIIIVSSEAAGNSFPAIAGYIAAKTAQITLAKCLAVEAEPLEIRVHYLLPNLTSQTDLGQSSVRTFARRAGVDEDEVAEQLGILPLLTPRMVGDGIWQILTDSAFREARGFRISGRGLRPIGAEEPILTG